MTTATAPTTMTTPAPDGPFLHVPTAKPQWMHYGDWVRILGTVAVVLGHVSDMTLFDGSQLGKSAWWTANWWDAATRWAVPVYIMLSGALLLDPARAESQSQFYRKRLARLGVPLVFWSAFFMWFDVYYTGWRNTVVPGYDGTVPGPDGPEHAYVWAGHSAWQMFVFFVFVKPQKAWGLLAIGEPYVHMHFIFRIAGLYAFTPLLRVIVRQVPRNMLSVAVVLMLVLSSADSVTNNFTETKLSLFARFVPFLGYYLLGYLLRDGEWSARTLALCWAGLVGSIATVALGTGWLVRHFVIDAGRTALHGSPSFEMILYDFLSPPRVVMAVCAWVVLTGLFRDPRPHGKAGRSAVRFWANTTLGLYLIHPLFRELWFTGRLGFDPHPWRHFVDHTYPWGTPFGVNASDWYQALFHHLAPQNAPPNPPAWQGPLLGVPVVAFLVYLPSLLATIVLMRIPFVRRITG